VTATDIAEELWNGKRIRVDRRKIDLHDPIKRIGRYEVTVELFTDVSVDVRVLVVPEGGELPPEEEFAAADEALAAEEAAAAEEADGATQEGPELEEILAEESEPEPVPVAEEQASAEAEPVSPQPE
jgi:hypothetical protein